MIKYLFNIVLNEVCGKFAYHILGGLFLFGLDLNNFGQFSSLGTL